ncbi:uncharacterized protein BN799_01143 [Prevotella sp. CAG:873]|jgi:hypothetical protein|nr:uncharacterized protein BN799_01143 [Prevotella sp. CAG:873]
MDARQFFERVKIMRHFQKEYFKTRSRTALQQSKALEREIDTEIERVNRLLKLPEYKQPETPSLFK